MAQEPVLPEQPASEPSSVDLSPTDSAIAEAAVVPPVSAAPAGLQPEIAARITAMLGQGQEYKQQLQYDKAIATAESVLMIDPGNRNAKRLMKEAKEGQQAALNSIEID